MIVTWENQNMQNIMNSDKKLKYLNEKKSNIHDEEEAIGSSNYRNLLDYMLSFSTRSSQIFARVHWFKLTWNIQAHDLGSNSPTPANESWDKDKPLRKTQIAKTERIYFKKSLHYGVISE